MNSQPSKPQRIRQSKRDRDNAIRLDERERCAKVVEDALNHYQDESCTLTMTVALHCIAADIRSGK